MEKLLVHKLFWLLENSIKIRLNTIYFLNYAIHNEGWKLLSINFHYNCYTFILNQLPLITHFDCFNIQFSNIILIRFSLIWIPSRILPKKRSFLLCIKKNNYNIRRYIGMLNMKPIIGNCVNICQCFECLVRIQVHGSINEAFREPHHIT